MSYADIFTVPDIPLLGLSVLQTAVIFGLIMAGLQVVGRRVFAQRSPQDLVIIVLVAETCGLGFAHQEAGFWGAVVSILTILIMGYLTERIKFIRQGLIKKPVILYQNRILDRELMNKHMVDESDIEEVAREKSAMTYKDFDLVVLEGDGRISLVKNEQSK